MLWPLEGVDPSDPTQRGYGFLEWTGDTFHPGIDLNLPGGPYADRGAAIVCPAPATVVFRQEWDGVTRGFGTHTWLQHDTGDYTHYCHLLTAPAPEGLALSPGSVFATCGRSGGWEYDHLHFEVWRGSVYGAPPSWSFWPKGYSQQWIAEHYADPIKWLIAQDRRLAALSVMEKYLSPATMAEVLRSPMNDISEATLLAVAEAVWRAGKQPFNPDAAIVRAWVEALRMGVYQGVPAGPEIAAGDGVFQRFTRHHKGDVLAVYENGRCGFAG